MYSFFTLKQIKKINYVQHKKTKISFKLQLKLPPLFIQYKHLFFKRSEEMKKIHVFQVQLNNFSIKNNHLKKSKKICCLNVIHQRTFLKERLKLLSLSI